MPPRSFHCVKQDFPRLGELPPRDRFTAFQIMPRCHQGVQHARVVTFAHAVGECEISLQWVAYGEFFGGVDAERTQITRDGLADVGEVFESLRAGGLHLHLIRGRWRGGG